jgi:nucleoside-diphosphate-sugar epimerase
LKILITGASGFLGSHLAIGLAASSHQIFLLLRQSSSLSRLEGCLERLNIKRFSGLEEIDKIFSQINPDLVIHAACSYGRKDESALEVLNTNVLYGIALLEAMNKSSGFKTFINVGSSLPPELSLYALSKLQFCRWGKYFAMQDQTRFRFINIILEHMYGPNDSATKFTTKVFRECLQNKPFIELTPGNQMRDFIYIDDVVSAFKEVIEDLTIFPFYKELEVGSGKALTIRSFVEMVHQITNSKSTLKFGAIPYRSKEVMFSEANLTEIKKIGWVPKIELEIGLTRMLREEL